jgi:GNAT superfamily N-acetyltransferase
LDARFAFCSLTRHDWRMTLRVQRFLGCQSEPYLRALARLRIEVFREWPYLYDGSFEYEAKYLRCYLDERAMIAVAFDDATEHRRSDADADGDDAMRVTGASTALPLTAHSDVQLSGLDSLGIDPEDVYYFGESVLLRPYRGHGIGHRFFDERETQARAFGFGWAAFCAVERPPSHPMRPKDDVPHDAFWSRRGYVRHPELRTELSWQDVGDDHETAKPMVFWLKRL